MGLSRKIMTKTVSVTLINKKTSVTDRVLGININRVLITKESHKDSFFRLN